MQLNTTPIGSASASVLNLTPFSVTVLLQSGDCQASMEIAAVLPPCDDRLLPYMLRHELSEFNRNSMEKEVSYKTELRFPFLTEKVLGENAFRFICIEDSVLDFLNGRYAVDVRDGRPVVYEPIIEEGKTPLWLHKVRPLIRSVIEHEDGVHASLGRRYMIVRKEEL